MHIMRLPRELELEGVWNHVKNVFRCYVDNHSPMLKQYTTLRRKDEFARRVISKQSDKIASATVINSELQDELIYLQTNKEMKTNDHTLTKGEMSRGFHRIKQKLEACNALDQKQLRFLVENSEKSIKRLQSLISKSGQATQIAEACYKYEKQEEIKYFRKQNKDKLFNISMDFEETEHLTEAMIDDYQVLERMANFWFKLNSVKINVNMLKVEKQNLRRENEELKASLKKYLTEVALADCRYQPTHRPASMYTYSSTTKAGEEMADKRFMFEKLPRPVTCIEANTCNAVQHERRQKVWNQRNNKQPIVTRSCW